jgi:hypothetical protein
MQEAVQAGEGGDRRVRRAYPGGDRAQAHGVYVDEAGLEALDPPAAARAGDERFQPAGQVCPRPRRADRAGAGGDGALPRRPRCHDQDLVEHGVALVPGARGSDPVQGRAAGGDERGQDPVRPQRRFEPRGDGARAGEHAEGPPAVAATSKRALGAGKPFAI